MADADQIWDLDNSGRGRLRVPGFDRIPIDYELKVPERFAHGFQEWRQSPVITAQELAMVAVMDRLTDKPMWFVDVFNDTIVEQWRIELDRDRFIANPRLMKGKTWTWCVKELRDKATYYKQHRHLRVLDTGSCICKADSTELSSLSVDFREAVIPLAEQYKTYQQRRELLGKTERSQFEQYADTDAWLSAGTRLVAGNQAQADDPEPTGDGHGFNDDALAPEDIREDSSILAGAQSVSDNMQTAEDDYQAEDHAETWQPIMMQHELEDFIPYSDTEDSDERQGDAMDTGWTWNRQTSTTHQREEELDIEGSAHMISILIDPLLFPLCYGETLVLQNSGTVALDNVLASYGAAQVAPRHTPRPAPEDWDVFLEQSAPWSQRYQSLPCEVAFAPDSGHDKTDVKITSYINGLHPDHTQMYQLIAKVLSCCIKPWNDCLVRGHCGLYDSNNQGQLGPLPARIITYGVEWENELPDWANLFRVPTKSTKEVYYNDLKKVQGLPENSKDRKREEDRLGRIFSNVIGKEDLKLPAADSDLWQWAREYLMRPEGPPTAPCPPCAEPSIIPDGWDVGDERTWDLLCEKARRLVVHKHPEPGTAFSYEEWKLGRHDSRPIVDMAVPEPGNDPWQREQVIVPPHVGYSMALEDRFRDQGLQVLVEVRSIDLRPEVPAYAPNAAEQEGAHTAWAAEKIAEAVSTNQAVDLEQVDGTDGWHLPGQLNEHIAAVAILTFDVENVTEPRVAFRQKIFHAGRIPIYRCHEFFDKPKDAPTHYNPFQDGPAHLVGKENDVGPLAEILGISERIIYPDNGATYDYQHIGSVATPQGRLVAFPNILEYRINPFRLVDDTKPGRYRWLTLYLVDPHYRVCSTRNVPPQQHAWWAEAVGCELAAAGLSQEIIDHIMQYTDNFPMGKDEAHWHREQLVQEYDQAGRWRMN